MTKTSILLPSAYRHRSLARALNLIEATTGLNNTEVIVGLVLGDTDSRHATDKFLGVEVDYRSREEYERGSVYAWNKLAELATGDVLALWADDLIPQPEWLTRSLNNLYSLNTGLVGFNDLSSDGSDYAAHWLADREFLTKFLGGVMYPPMYLSWWCDREVSDRAKALNRYTWAKAAIVEHRHPSFGKADEDQTYRDAMPNYEADHKLYIERKAAGFPNDYAPCISSQRVFA